MFDPQDVRPGQVTLRIEAVPGTQPIWVRALGPDAESHAAVAVEALAGYAGEGALHAVTRVEGPLGTRRDGSVPGWEIDLRDAAGRAEVERRVSESVGARGVAVPGSIRFNEYAAWGDRRLEVEISRCRVGMGQEWPHHREQTARTMAAMEAERRVRAVERSALASDAAPTPYQP